MDLNLIGVDWKVRRFHHCLQSQLLGVIGRRDSLQNNAVLSNQQTDLSDPSPQSVRDALHAKGALPIILIAHIGLSRYFQILA
jgi:hypothetical protein